MPKLCPIHGKPPVIYYPCCRGAAGGKVASAQKAQSSRENLEKARRVKADKPRPP